ncbi:MAG: flagellar hook-associated protein FlgK [Candidatus Marinimicrobia bacterium]|nr:flagellar hook-associated protein FlgK [Candidatus Neomarinimicrobiota bacterium]
MSISNILNTSKQALMSHQSAIDTTSNNISNMNTEGYTRRLTNFEQGLSINNVNSNISDETLSRVRDSFIEKQYIRQNSYASKYEMDETISQQIEDILGEPGNSGLTNSLSAFWESWSDLANDPESQSVRTVVKDKAKALSRTFNRIYSDFNQLRDSIKEDVSRKVNSVNQKLEQLNKINKQLNTTKTDDLLDQRDMVLNDLSELINIETSINDDGKISVYSSGQILVSENQVQKLNVQTEQQNNNSSLKITAGDNEYNIQIKAGEIGSLLDINNENIPNYIDQLNTLASNLTQEVNDVHSSGYNLDDVSGINFFKDDISSAGEMDVNELIKSDPGLIAASDKMGESGNNNIAQAINDLQNENIIQGVAPSDFYNSLVTEIGSKVQESSYLRTSQEKVVQTLQNQRDSASGISLDEEMINLTKYEQGYHAAAKVVNTVNEMMSTVINLI